MTPSSTPPSFYVTGGTLSTSATSYVVRQADRELFENLLAGEFCYVLNSRQMGKSSLMVRAAERLKAAGVRTAILDLTAVGQNVTPEQWYNGLLSRLGLQLELEDQLEAFYLGCSHLSPLQRWQQALTSVVLPRMNALLVIFVDEIDVVRSLPFSADEFFAGIRQCYVGRATDPNLERLSICLLGAATPADLIQDTRTSPFNIGTRIDLRDFSTSEAAPLAQGLGEGADNLLDRILYWTGGHPYLTQRLCRAVAEADHTGVDRLCNELFLTQRARETDDNLMFVRNRLLRSEVDLASLLDQYRQVRTGKRVPDDETNPLTSVLKLSGVAQVERGLLKVRNRIYDHVFDRAWVIAHMPDAELRRLKRAYHLGLIRAASISSLVLTVVVALAVVALDQSRRADRVAREERRQRGLAQDRAQTTRQMLYASDMNGAFRAWEDGDTRRAQNMLAAHEKDEDLQAFEWRLLQSLCRANYLTKLNVRQISPQQGVEFTRDGRGLLYSDEKGFIESETGSGRLRRTFSIPCGHIDAGVLLPDGRICATWDSRAGAKIWNVSARKQIAAIPGLIGVPTVFAFSRDCKLLATGAWDGPKPIVRLFDVFSGKLVGALTGFSEHIVSLAISRDAKSIAVGDADTNVSLWEVRNLLRPNGPVFLRPGHTAWPLSLDFSPDGHTLASSGNDNSIRIWDTRAHTLVTTLLAHKSPVSRAIFSADGRLLASCGSDGSVKLWDTREWGRYVNLSGHTAAADTLAFSPNSKTLATASSGDRSILVWDTSPTRESGSVLAHTHWVSSVVFSPQGDVVATTDCHARSVKLWAVATGRLVGPVLGGHGGLLWDANFSVDGTRLVSACNPGEARVWNVKSRKLTHVWRAHEARAERAFFSPGMREVVTYGMGSAMREDRIRIWDWQTRRKLADAPGKWPVFARRSGTFVLNDDHGNCHIWDSTSHREVGVLKEAGWAFALSDDGVTLATFAAPGLAPSASSIHLWDLRSMKPTATFQEQDNIDYKHAVFSPDGKTLAIGTSNGTIVFWNPVIGRELGTIRAHHGPVTGVAFSPDGNVFATSGGDGVARLWRTAPSPGRR